MTCRENSGEFQRNLQPKETSYIYGNRNSEVA